MSVGIGNPDPRSKTFGGAEGCITQGKRLFHVEDLVVRSCWVGVVTEPGCMMS